MRSASQLAKATGAPKTLNTIRPAGVAVSSDSDKLTNSIPDRGNEKKASKTNKNLILPVSAANR
jgi:hypothetical protein